MTPRHVQLGSESPAVSGRSISCTTSDDVEGAMELQVLFIQLPPVQQGSLVYHLRELGCIDTFALLWPRLDMRHGCFEVNGVDLEVLAIVTYTPGVVWGDSGSNGLAQSYRIELNVERLDGNPLRMLAVWVQPASNIVDPDSAFSLTYAVSKRRDASGRLSGICSGKIELD